MAKVDERCVGLSQYLEAIAQEAKRRSGCHQANQGAHPSREHEYKRHGTVTLPSRPARTRSLADPRAVFLEVVLAGHEIEGIETVLSPDLVALTFFYPA